MYSEVQIEAKNGQQ